MESLSQELDKFDLITKNLDVISRSSEENEYEMYISQNPIQISGSALDWWLHDEQQQRWPWLSQMAIDLLSIPAMSNEPE
jgi:hAT family C-terminal dimerisation region